MRKTVTILAVVTMLSVCALSYGGINTGHYVLVYKGTLSASRTIFDVNDATKMLSGSTKCFFAMDINEPNHEVIDSNAVLFSQKEKEYTVIPDAITINPHDPCFVELFTLGLVDVDGGDFSVEAIGIGKLTKIYNADRADANTLVKKFVPPNMKGGGSSFAFNFLDAGQAFSGTFAVKMTLDPRQTKLANSDGNNVDGVTNSFISVLNKKGNFTKFDRPPVID